MIEAQENKGLDPEPEVEVEEVEAVEADDADQEEAVIDVPEEQVAPHDL